jgi:hypothetical protein
MLVNDVQNAFPLWHVERRRRFDPGRARVIPDGPAESLATSVFLPPLEQGGGRLRRLYVCLFMTTR